MGNVSVNLNYGRSTISLEIPERNLTFLNPDLEGRNIEPAVALEEALENPIDSVALEDFVEDHKVCVLVDDSRRKEPHREIVEALSKRLVTARRILFMIATGTHDPGQEGNVEIRDMIREVASQYGLNFDVMANYSDHKADFEEVGITSRGIKVSANRFALDADVFVVASDMKPHYFGGYSSAIKNFMPGICSYETISANHCKLIAYENSHYGFHPWHYDESRRDNPIAADMLEAMELIANGRSIFLLATMSDEGLLWSRAGNMEYVTREGIMKVDELFSFSVEPSKYIVVSPGGWPFDRYFYSAQRSLELIRDVIGEDGEIILLAECIDGIHSKGNEIEEFHDALKKGSSWLRKRLEEDKPQFYFYKAYRFRNSLENASRVYLCSSLGSALRDIDLIPTDDPQSIIDGWLKKDPEAKILVINKANKLAVYRK